MIKLNLVSTLISFFMSLNCFAEKVPMKKCDEVLKGFNIYEVLDKGKVEQRFSIFAVQNWSKHSAFQGILTKETDLNLVIQFAGKKERPSFKFKSWSVDPVYLVADGFDGIKTFENATGSYVIEAIRNGKTLCKQNFKVEPLH